MKDKLKQFFSKKSVRTVLICLAALALLIAVWCVFFRKEKTDGYAPTAEEARLAALLSEIDGVGEATVMITERDGVPSGAVVVFYGEDGILIRSRLIDVTANALGIPTSSVRVYPSNGKSI